MDPTSVSAFNLPERLAAKSDPRLLSGDEAQFAVLAASLEATIAELSDRLAAAQAAPGGIGQEAMDRDFEVHRLSARLRTLRQFGLDLCLGRMVIAGAGGGDSRDPYVGAEVVYVGRLGLVDPSGRRLMIDWRSPAAEPFFAATHANPMGLASRRRYRWVGGRIADYWDEVFAPDLLDPDGPEGPALDDQSAFIASLGASRSARMQDVLSTIQADQDAIIRAGSPGALVVHGGPGTGKTVVALHRAAYLLYADPRLGHRRGGVLFIGPHQPYLDYVSDVLPSLGEDGVRTCTLWDLLPAELGLDPAAAPPEPDPLAARLKASARMSEAIEAAVALYEEPPIISMLIETPWADVRVEPRHWADAFASVPAGTPHNDAREGILAELVANL
ncbi:MAG: AAA family ATPase, partial [Frankiaceae bacterium]|nr:AAA family ATPase [Frankiaceae bacterium]